MASLTHWRRNMPRNLHRQRLRERQNRRERKLAQRKGRNKQLFLNEIQNVMLLNHDFLDHTYHKNYVYQKYIHVHTNGISHS